MGLKEEEEEEFVLKGKPVHNIPDCSIAEYLLPKIKSHPKGNVLQVDGITGVIQTSEEFLRRSVSLSRGLRKIGLKENYVVATLVRNCFELFEVIFSTWLSAGAVAPVDGNMTVFELKHIFRLIHPKFIICEENVVEKVSSAINLISLNPTILIVRKKQNSLYDYLDLEEVYIYDGEVESFKLTPVRSPSTQLAAIFPSSGTSGLPKEIGITHKNLVFQNINIQTLPLFNSKKILLQISHFYWITGLLTFLWNLVTGTKRIILMEINNTSLLETIHKYKTQWTICAPLSWAELLNVPEFDRYDITSMNAIFLGGSPFTPSIAEKIKGKCDHTTVMQIYGQTESTGCISHTCENSNVYSLGRLSDGLELKIVDTKTGKSLEATAFGEICVRSPGIMKGYVGNEEETKKSIDEEGWLHTGDLGYYNENGEIHIVDRLKEMVKVRNMQVAPVEVECVVMSIPGVLECGVVGVPHTEDLHRLAGIVVKDKKSNVTENDIFSHVKNTLSEYKHLTAGIFFVENLPKNANGKLKRGELKELAKRLSSKAA